jgi:single-strand DNA-binding protein
VLIEGRLKLDRWEKDGQKHSKLKVVGDKLQMLGGKGEGGGGGGGGGGRGRSRGSSEDSGGSYDEGDQYTNVGAPPPSDDIPF